MTDGQDNDISVAHLEDDDVRFIRINADGRFVLSMLRGRIRIVREEDQRIVQARLIFRDLVFAETFKPLSRDRVDIALSRRR